VGQILTELLPDDAELESAFEIVRVAEQVRRACHITDNSPDSVRFVRTWTFPDRHPTVAGPWENEPDKAQWIDADTDLDCLAVRNHMGAWCGYVGVPPGHPWHGRGYSDDVFNGVEVHGGLTFSEFCREDVDPETTAAVCHVPEPGRPDHVWWLGFDCAHYLDYLPRMRDIPGVDNSYDKMVQRLGARYKTLQYVQIEVHNLAVQIRAAA